jgi:hypothetical protein
MLFSSDRLLYERITQNHAKELKSVLCDPIVYVHVDDGLAPNFDELLESFRLREKGSSEVSNDNLPPLASYNENDWVFFRKAAEN